MRISFFVFFIASIAFSAKAQDILVSEIDALPEIEEAVVVDMQMDTLVGDTVYSNYIYQPSLEELAMDSLRSSPDRVVLPDSLDTDSMKIKLAPIMLNKVRLDNGVLITDVNKEDFSSLGLPDIVYDYFLQELNGYNFENQLYQKPKDEIEYRFEKMQEEIRTALYILNLKTQQRELVANNKEIFNLIDKMNKRSELTLKEIKMVLLICEPLSDKLELVDGEMFLDISDEQLQSESQRSSYLLFVLKFINYEFEIENYSLKERQNTVNQIRDSMREACKYLQAN